MSANDAFSSFKLLRVDAVGNPVMESLDILNMTVGEFLGEVADVDVRELEFEKAGTDPAVSDFIRRYYPNMSDAEIIEKLREAQARGRGQQ